MANPQWRVCRREGGEGADVCGKSMRIHRARLTSDRPAATAVREQGAWLRVRPCGAGGKQGQLEKYDALPIRGQQGQRSARRLKRWYKCSCDGAEAAAEPVGGCTGEREGEGGIASWQAGSAREAALASVADLAWAWRGSYHVCGRVAYVTSWPN